MPPRFMPAAALAALLAAVVVPLAAAPALAHQIYIPPPSPTEFTWQGRHFKFAGLSMNGKGNVVNVAPGAAVDIRFGFYVTADRGDIYCPNCVLSEYLGIAGEFSTCFAHRIEARPGSSRSVNVSFRFTAPERPGIYYLTWSNREQFNCDHGVHHNNSEFAVGVVTVGQEPWELSKVFNRTGKTLTISEPLPPGTTYTNDFTATGHSIAIPGVGALTFTNRGHDTGCQSPYWAVRVDYQTVQGQSETWGFFYDRMGEINVEVKSDYSIDVLGRGHTQTVRGLGRPTCKR